MPRCFFLFFCVATSLVSASLSARSSEAIVSHIPRRPITSTAIAAIGYSRKLQALEIQFRNGAIYRYLEVPSETYRDLLAAESKATYYDNNIRHHFRSVHVKARS